MSCPSIRLRGFSTGGIPTDCTSTGDIILGGSICAQRKYVRRERKIWLHKTKGHIYIRDVKGLKIPYVGSRFWGPKSNIHSGCGGIGCSTEFDKRLGPLMVRQLSGRVFMQLLIFGLGFKASKDNH